MTKNERQTNMPPPLIGNSSAIIKIRELIEHVADTGLNTVISGQSGVGKEVVAQNLYFKSRRRDKPFIKINCAALPDGLLESELFGYAQGAFTGADRKKRGQFELAHEGILFLDEIGDMSLPLQAKLLHVLQSGVFTPLGSEKEVTTDAWVIAATNQELEQNVKNGMFREDLYYRLNIIRIYIPPLCSRPDDIPLLIDYYIDKYGSQFDFKQITKPSSDVMDKLVAYHWPGNVRELQNVLKRCMVVSNWEDIINEISDVSCEDKSAAVQLTVDDVSTVDDLVNLEEDSLDSASFSLKTIKKKALDRIEKEVISHVLVQTGWNRSNACKILKISYKTLLYKIRNLHIQPPTNLKDETPEI